MLKGFFRLGAKKVLGIDVGTSSIKIVELKRKGKGFSLENYGELKIQSPEKTPFRVFKKNTLLLSDKSIAEAIKGISDEAGIKTKEAHCHQYQQQLNHLFLK